MSSLEFKLLRYFIEHPGALVSRRELLEKVWGYPAVLQTRTVDVHVASLRQKIEPHPAKPEYVVTVHRMGYRFQGGRPMEFVPREQPFGAEKDRISLIATLEEEGGIEFNTNLPKETFLRPR